MGFDGYEDRHLCLNAFRCQWFFSGQLGDWIENRGKMAKTSADSLPCSPHILTLLFSHGTLSSSFQMRGLISIFDVLRLLHVMPQASMFPARSLHDLASCAKQYAKPFSRSHSLSCSWATTDFISLYRSYTVPTCLYSLYCHGLNFRCHCKFRVVLALRHHSPRDSHVCGSVPSHGPSPLYW